MNARLMGLAAVAASSALVEEAEVKVAVTPRAVDYTFKGEELHISRKCAHGEAGTVGKRRERCSEDGGVLRSMKILTHGGWKIWYNTQRTPRWVDNRPLSFGNAVQGSDRKVWGPCLFLG